MNRWWLLVLIMASVQCGGSPTTPTAPAVPVVPACVTLNTATVYFQNRSATNRTYDIVFDGGRIATVAPGMDSPIFTVAANVSHSLRFQFTNTTALACTEGRPLLTVCAEMFFGCNG